MNELEASDVRDSLQAIAETYCRDTPNPSVCVADGHGIRVDVEKGHLEVHDGLGQYRRVRRYAKATHQLSRVVVLGASGMITLRALQWCRRASVALAVLDPSDGAVLMTGAACEVDDSRLRRSQALSLFNESGLVVTKYLIGRKLAGQADVAERQLQDDDAAIGIRGIACCIGDCDSVEDVLYAEGAAANRYWLAWEHVTMTFTKRDDLKIPEHWRTFSGRKSAVGTTNRLATSPITSCQNYLYRLVEAEVRLAILTMGLDPSMGIVHGGRRNYDGFVYDCMEAARPVADEYLATLLKSHVFQKRDFSEDDRGIVRVLSPFSHVLASAMPLFAEQLAPVVEHVALMLAKSNPYEMSVPTKLTGMKHRDAARQRKTAAAPGTWTDDDRQMGDNSRSGVTPGGTGLGRGGVKPRTNDRQRPMKPSRSSVMPRAVCVVCGSELPWEPDRRGTRSRYCGDCTAERRAEIGAMIQSMPKQRRALSPEAAARKVEMNRSRRLGELEWEKAHEGEVPDRDSYLREILPGLRTVSLTTISRATGMSTSAASKVRSGKRVPHPRHWRRLSTLLNDQSSQSLGDCLI